MQNHEACVNIKYNQTMLIVTLFSWLVLTLFSWLVLANVVPIFSFLSSFFKVVPSMIDPISNSFMRVENLGNE